MKRFSYLLLPLVIFIVLIFRWMSIQHTAENGVRILVPVSITGFEKSAFSDFLKLRYHNFIPASEITGKQGIVVVSRSVGGHVHFERQFEKDVPLRPQELLLKYAIVYQPSLFSKDSKSGIRFAGSTFKFKGKRKTAFKEVKYAVLNVNKNGNAVLVGLSDGNGVLLLQRN